MLLLLLVTRWSPRSLKRVILNHRVSAVKPILLGSMVCQMKFTMRFCEINLEVDPSLLRCWAQLPCTTSISKKVSVKNKSVSSVNNHFVPVRFSTRKHKSSSILEMLEQGFNRLNGIIRRVEPFVAMCDFRGRDHGTVC
jgi:hypothetical protein